MQAKRARCPRCHKPVETAPGSRPKDYPFCSERCRLLDLDRWLRGEYSIPVTAPSPPVDAEE